MKVSSFMFHVSGYKLRVYQFTNLLVYLFPCFPVYLIADTIGASIQEKDKQ